MCLHCARQPFVSATLKVLKTGNKKHATCFATLLQNELQSNVARFATLIKYFLHQNRLLTGLNVGGKTCNIAFQLVLQHCCKTNCMFFVARFSVPLTAQLPKYVHKLHVFFIFFLQICPHAGVSIEDADNREGPSRGFDQNYIDSVAELIKARFPGVKPEPSIKESCIYSVSI